MRISGGGSPNVNILQSDAGQYRDRDFVVDSGLAFGGEGNTGPSVGDNSHSQVFNPAASGVALLIDDIWLSISVTGIVSLRFHDTALTSVAGAWLNMKRDAAAGNAIIRIQNNAGLLGTAFTLLFLLADTPIHFHFASPILLPEDTGVLAVPQTTNVALNTGFFGREI